MFSRGMLGLLVLLGQYFDSRAVPQDQQSPHCCLPSGRPAKLFPRRADQEGQPRSALAVGSELRAWDAALPWRPDGLREEPREPPELPSDWTARRSGGASGAGPAARDRAAGARRREGGAGRVARSRGAREGRAAPPPPGASAWNGAPGNGAASPPAPVRTPCRRPRALAR